MSNRYISIDNREYARLQSTRTLAVALLLIWIFRLSFGLGLAQLMQPIFSDTKADRFYWLLDSIGILDVIITYFPISVSIDILLFVFPVLIFVQPSNRIYPIIYFFGLTMYFTAYNVSATHQEHTLSGAIATAFLLCFKDKMRFSTVFLSVRYYACFLMSSAFFWKLSRGALWHDDQMTNILKTQHVTVLTQSHSTLYSSWINYIVDNPVVASTLWWAAACIELSFLIGFFSRRFDNLLFILFWLFIVADYLVMGLHFWELGILSLYFLRKQYQHFD